MEPKRQVEEYLTHQRYSLQNGPGRDFVLATRATDGGQDTMLVWLPRNKRGSSELDEIDDAFSDYPDARGVVLVPTREGLTRNFLREARLSRVQILVPVQFFDADYRTETSPDAASTIKSLRSPHLAGQRIPQPYTLIGQTASGSTDADLLDILYRKFLLHFQDGKPSLRIVVGPAGYGKSLLFQSLFGHLYNHFLEEKRGQRNFPRPIPLLPEYLRDEYGAPRTVNLIDSFIRTDVAKPVTQETLEWMVTNSYCTWLFDGLDELYTSDPEFFDIVLDILTRPGTTAQILICARDSLLTTNDSLMQFLELEEYQGEPGSLIELYRLNDWENHSKRALASLRLEEEEDVEKFMQNVGQNPSLKDISKTPYYCDLLLDEYKKIPLSPLTDEFSILSRTVDSIIEREIKKGLFSLNHFDDESIGLRTWIEQAAVDAYRANYTGFSKDDLENYAEIVLSPGLSEEEKDSIVTSLIQFPLFTQGIAPGKVNFKHELIAEYLAAESFASAFKTISDSTGVKRCIDAANLIGDRSDFAESLTCRFIAREIEGNEEMLNTITQTVRDSSLTYSKDRSFSYLLQILIASSPGTNIFQRDSLLEDKDLRDMKFDKLNLDGVSFRNSDLSRAKFVSCSLREAKFENTIFSETSFENMGKDSLLKADFSALQHCESIRHRGKRVSGENLKAWVSQVTGKTLTLPVGDPCPTAKQLRSLFQKYVGIGGKTYVKDSYTMRTLLRGTRRVKNAATTEECVKLCVSRGYLLDPDYRGRYQRQGGRQYDDMVSYVRKQELSEQIRLMLDSLCKIPNCRHILF